MAGWFKQGVFFSNLLFSTCKRILIEYLLLLNYWVSCMLKPNKFHEPDGIPRFTYLITILSTKDPSLKSISNSMVSEIFWKFKFKFFLTLIWTSYMIWTLTKGDFLVRRYWRRIFSSPKQTFQVSILSRKFEYVVYCYGREIHIFSSG